jgi:endonuclease/exonuclease/phosphatase family metal-dependent hydrolase
MSGNDGGRLRVATYNVHGCRGMDGRRSEERIAEVIAMLDVDVIGVQELDLNRPRSAGVDQAAVIAKHLGWHHHFHPALRVADAQYGDAILSRYPMKLRKAQELPSVRTRVCPESRAAIWVEIETPGGAVQMINTHLGLGRRERFMQAQLLAGPEWLGGFEKNDPVILMGDFNSLPGSPPFELLARQLRDARTFVSPTPRLRTFPTRLPLLAVDHILVNDRLRVHSIKVARNASTKIASDHFPIVADLRHNPKRSATGR